MKHKTFSVLLAACLVFTAVGLTGCGDSADDNGLNGFSEEPVEMATDTAPTDLTAGTDFTDSSGTMDGGTTDSGVSAGVGQMMVTPFGSDALAPLAGTNALTFYFQNSGVTLGAGTVTVYNANDNSVFASVDTTESDRWSSTEMTSNGAALTGWQLGRVETVVLPKCFLPSQSYYVLLDKGCFASGNDLSAEILDPSQIFFTTRSYGVMPGGIDKEVPGGENVPISIILSGDAVSARIENMYGVSKPNFNQMELSTSGTFQALMPSFGDVSFNVTYYNANGDSLASLPFSFTAIKQDR